MGCTAVVFAALVIGRFRIGSESAERKRRFVGMFGRGFEASEAVGGRIVGVLILKDIGGPGEDRQLRAELKIRDRQDEESEYGNKGMLILYAHIPSDAVRFRWTGRWAVGLEFIPDS